MSARANPPGDLAALVLAAGAGVRLRPLTLLRPKALCPVGNVPLLDLAIAVVTPITRAIAVNVHHGRLQMEEHLTGRAHLSFEEPQPLGSAGAIGALREWIDGRSLLLVNADRWHADDLCGLIDGWDRERTRLLVVEDPERGDFGTHRHAGAALMPWNVVRAIPAERAGILETSWQGLHESGRLEFVRSDAPFIDCGTPTDYHRANMAACAGGALLAADADVIGSATASVVGAGARVEGQIDRCVVWPGARVRRGESLSEAIRASDDVTVFV